MFPLVLLATAIGAPNPSRHEKPTAAGQTVMLLRTETPAAPARPGDPPVPLSGTELPAVREEAGRVLVRSQGRDGWVPRDDVLTPTEAVAYYTRQIEANPQDTSPRVRRAKAHELLADWDSAIRDYDELLKLSPRSSAYWNNRANYYSRKHEFDKALAGYDEALKISPTSHVPAGNKGNVYVSLRDWDKALAAYGQAVQTNPHYGRGYAGLSAAWREQREYDKALAEGERAVELEPTSPHTLSARANAHAARKEWDKARADFDAARRMDPYFAPAYVGLAGVHLALQEYQPAIRDLDEAMRLSPGNTAAMARRAEVWVACGNPRRALADLDEALAVDAKFGPGHRQRAWLLATHPDAAIRDGKAAVAAARQAVEHTRDAGGETWEALAAALAESGDFAGAAEWQKKAVADSGYVRGKGAGVQKRLELYEAGKPYRE